MPTIRGIITSDQAKVRHLDDSEAFEQLAALGTSCPDPFMRTKIRPLGLSFDPLHEDLLKRLLEAIGAYRAD